MFDKLLSFIELYSGTQKLFPGNDQPGSPILDRWKLFPHDWMSVRYRWKLFRHECLSVRGRWKLFRHECLSVRGRWKLFRHECLSVQGRWKLPLPEMLKQFPGCRQ